MAGFGSLAPGLSWQDAEALSNLEALQQQKAEEAAAKRTWGDTARDWLGAPYNLVKGVVAAPYAGGADLVPQQPTGGGFGALNPMDEVASIPRNNPVANLAGGLVESVVSGAKLPGDVATGKISMTDPEGRSSPELIHRAFDTASLAGGGATFGQLARPAAEAAAPVAAAEAVAARPTTLARAPALDAVKQGGTWFAEDAAKTGAPLTALERAVVQGYDVETPRYHGTSKDADFKKFKDSRHGTWTTTDPKEASSYAAQNDSRGLRYEGREYVPVNSADRVLPLVAKPLENPYVVAEYPEKVRYATNYKKAQSEWFDELRRAGHDGVDFGNGVRVDFNNANLRSRFAQFDPAKEGKSGLLLEDAAASGAPIAAAGHAQKFYSALDRAVEAIPQNTMTAEQWAGTLANKGVKAEERAVRGLDEFLTEKAGQPVTKQEVLAHLEQNKVELGEVQKGARPALNTQEAAQLADLDRRFAEGDMTLNADDAATRAELQFKQKRMDDSAQPTKYEGYQLPGGENYREKLLTLPGKKPDLPTPEQFKLLDDKWTAGEQLTPAEMRQHQNYERSLNGHTIRGETPEYKSSHWDEPNVLAHRRTNERDVGGKRSLHIEEIQSDWHQAGRKSGYASGDPDKNFNAFVDDMRKQVREGVAKDYVDGGMAPAKAAVQAEKFAELEPHNLAKYLGPEADMRLRELHAERMKTREGVPDAPFKKNWHELALKDAIREAAESGLDRISWTPGEAQAARYDLSKQISTLKVRDAGDGFTVKALSPDGKSAVFERKVSGEQLPDVIGKDLSEKILNDYEEHFNSSSKPFVRDYSGVDLKVGGEGMKGFYDKIIPDALNKIGKKHGVKVEFGRSAGRDKDFMSGSIAMDRMTGKPGWEDIPARGDSRGEWFAGLDHERREKLFDQARNIDAPVHYMDIPQSLKDEVLQKGFSLFEDSSATGAPIAAVENATKIRDPHGFGALDAHPNERALTVNDILGPEMPKMKAGSRDVETIAKELVDRGSSALKKLGVDGGRIEKSAPHTDELLARGIASEIKAALGRGNSASDWYTTKIKEAMDHAADIHPELKNDPHQKMGFTTALAVTSQGEAVSSNVRLANMVYDHFKKTGRFPTDETIAKNGPAMASNFRKMNALLDELGPEGTREFLHKEFTVKELEQAGYDVGGENKQTKVYGSAILGPKIGQGFYQNLNGNYKPVTMDLWFMRAWGRMTGTLVGKTDLSKPIARLQEAMRAEGMRVPRDPAKLAEVARAAVLQHERDFRANRAAYDSGKKKKSELTYAAERYEKNATGINEQPTSGSQRTWMRDVVNRAREILEDHGHKVTNADLQAIWWYPEKELYSKLGGRDSDKINIDYATAFRDLKNKGGGGEQQPAAVRPVVERAGANQGDVAGRSKVGGAGGKKAARQKVSSFGSLAPGLA